MTGKLISGLAIATLSTAVLLLGGCADTQNEYRTQTIPQGGSRSTITLVPVESAQAEAPYALTGERTQTPRKAEISNPRGTH